MSARSALARIAKLENARRVPRTPFELAYGSLEAWEAEIRAEVEAGKLDATDLLGADGSGGILRAIWNWHERGLYGVWRRDRHRVWEMGQ